MNTFDVASLLPIVALGTVADIVPLQGENRILVKAGLERLNRRHHLGLAILKDTAGLKDAATTVDLGYRLAPRINASGRIDNPYLAIELLMAQGIAKAKQLAKELGELNEERQQLEKETCEEAFRQLEKTFHKERDFAAVAVHEEWHPGVIGLVAGKVMQKFHVPSIAFHIDKDSGTARGSGRCPIIEGLDLMALLGQCSEHLLHFGGHSAAAGMSVKTESLDNFIHAFKIVCEKALAGKRCAPALDIDAYIELDDLTLAFHDEIQKLEPCGQSNPSARWAIRSAELAQDPMPVGSEGKHARLIFRRGGKSLTAMMFGVEPDIFKFKAGNKLDIVFTTRINTYFQDPELQLYLDDVRLADFVNIP